MTDKTRPGRDVRPEALDRRSFLRRSGLAAAGLAAASMTLSRFAPVRAADGSSKTSADHDVIIRRTVCNGCSVGCTVLAEVQNGVWISQEPDFDSPISLGGHCAKGAGARYDTVGTRRLRQPIKLDRGQWTSIDWDKAITEVGERLLSVRAANGPDSVYWLGSGTLNDQQAYLVGKLARFFGTNNVDHEGRLFHAGMDSGLSETWGFGASSNSLNDLQHARSLLVIGGSPAEDAPVAMLHMLRAKERNSAPLIVCDTRFSRTAVHADEFVRLRPGTEVALIWGIAREIFANGWEDKKFLRQRVGGADRVQQEIEYWTADEVARVTGIPAALVTRVAKVIATNRPGAVIWTTPGSQGAQASSAARALAVLQLILGNVGVSGGGVHGLRLFGNGQGASDMGLTCDSLPGYYGLEERAWRHWARVWQVDYDYLVSRFNGKPALMQKPGIPASRWFDGTAAKGETAGQPAPVRAVVIWGHAAHLTSRLPAMKTALESLDLVVNIAPYPNMAVVMAARSDNVYLLPSCSAYEAEGSVTASNRSVQWRDRVVKPLFQSRPDEEIAYRLARTLGFAEGMFKSISQIGGVPGIEDIMREASRGLLAIGRVGHSAVRIRRHMQYGRTFDRTTLRARGGPVDGDYYGLPWPCWGKPAIGHPGTPNMFDTSLPVAQGGGCFPAIFGLERKGRILWAEESYPAGSDIKDGYPEFDAALITHLHWDTEINAAEKKQIADIEGDKTDWRTDLSGAIHRIALAHGCIPYGNGKARAYAWDMPDPVPLHREPLYTTRRDLVESGKADGHRLYLTYTQSDLKDIGNRFRVSTPLEPVQKQDFSAEYPLILVTGRLPEHSGGGDASRSNAWLAELSPRMFIEINPADANDQLLRNGDAVWVAGPDAVRIRVAARITERVPRGVVFLPIHFGGHWLGQSLRRAFPKDTDAFALGDPASAIMGFGYDPVSQAPEVLCGLCRFTKA